MHIEIMLHGVAAVRCVARSVVARVSPPYGDSRLVRVSLVCELMQHVNAYSPVHAVSIEIMLYGMSAVCSVAW